MEHQKILKLLNEVILNFSQGNRTLSMINQMQIMIYKMELSITQKF